jgi:hypothetical protein
MRSMVEGAPRVSARAADDGCSLRPFHRPSGGPTLRPREAGEGDHAKHGGGSAARVDLHCRRRLLTTPLPPPFGRSNSPPPRSGGGGPCEAWWRGRGAYRLALRTTAARHAPSTALRAVQLSAPAKRGRGTMRSMVEGARRVSTCIADDGYSLRPFHRPSGGPSFRPREAGEGDHAKHGGGGAARIDSRCGRRLLATPLPPPFGRSPSPAPRGRMKSHYAMLTLTVLVVSLPRISMTLTTIV